MKCLVLILVGLPGCGKTTASKFFTQKEIPVVRMGDFTDLELKKRHLPPSCKNEEWIRNNLRRRLGEDIYAKNTVRKVLSLGEVNNMVVVEGMKSKAELRFFQKKFTFLKVIFIETMRKLRYKRLRERVIRPFDTIEAEARDDDEIHHYKLPELKKETDFLVNNNKSLKEFQKQLSNILKQIPYD